jgi:hypothetical protein
MGDNMKNKFMLALSIGSISVMSACTLPGPNDPVGIIIDGNRKEQIIPAKNFVVIYAGDSAPDALNKTLNGKLLVGGKTFDMLNEGGFRFSYTTDQQCSLFPSGLQSFKYQLFKDSKLYKEDSTQVTVDC